MEGMVSLASPGPHARAHLARNSIEGQRHLAVGEAQQFALYYVGVGGFSCVVHGPDPFTRPRRKCSQSSERILHTSGRQTERVCALCAKLVFDRRPFRTSFHMDKS